MHLCVKAWSVSGAEWAGKEHNDFRKKRRIGDTLCKRFSMLPKALYYETRIRERQSPMEYIDFLWMPWQITAKLEVKTTKMYFLTVLQAPAYESVLLDSNQGVALSQLLMVLPFLERSKSVGHSVVSDSLPPMLGSLPSFSVHGIFPGKNTGVTCIPFSRGSSQCRGGTKVSSIAGRSFTIWDTKEAHSFACGQITRL